MEPPEDDSPMPFQRQASPFSCDSAGSQHTQGSIGSLSEHQSATLASRRRRSSLKSKKEERARRHSFYESHHQPRPRSLFTALVSGAINWLLMFGLCCAYGMIMFSDDWHLQHRTLGVKMNLATAFFVGISLSFSSKIQVAIGGPDLNPVVFLAGFVEVIGQDIASQLGLTYPSERRLFSSFDYSRRLGSSEGHGVGFCVDEHLNLNKAECSEYHEQLRATVIFATTVSSAALGGLFFSIGRLRLTRLVRYVPTCIMEAFLSCVGYKVFKYALKFCKFDAVQFVPAAFVGVLVYFLKALHIGKPALMIPTMLLTPLAIFYGVVFGSGSSLEEARVNGFMFPEMEDVAFWAVWTDGMGNFSKINFNAWLRTLPDLAVMIVVCLLDCLLKLSGTETKLPVKVDQDFEVSLFGLSNLFTVASGSSVGYMQLKFNVINFGILGNSEDRRGGLFYALLCGVCFFGTVEHFNLQPRFFLGMLLFFAGAGFVAENLWGSRAYLTSREWMQIFAILGVFIFTERLVYAVAVGGILTCVDFIATYARISCVLGEPVRGGELSTEERYDPVLQQNLKYVKDNWLLLIKLKGFVFFGSAQSLIVYVQNVIGSQSTVQEYKRLKFIVFDCKLLDGMDVSAAKSFRKIVCEAGAIGIRVLWSHVERSFVHELKQRQILYSNADWFADLREAVRHVEHQAIQYLMDIQTRWLSIHPSLALYKKAMDAQANFEPFEDILTLDTMRYGCPWLYCNRMQLEKHTTLLWEPGQVGVDLFLIHTGAVGLYTALPAVDSNDEWPMPLAVYRHGWFINCEMITGSGTRYYAIALENGEAVCWNERQWYRLTEEQPHMASAISKSVMKQQRADWEILEMDADQALGNIGRSLTRRFSKSMALTSTNQAVPSDHDMPQIPDKLQSRIDRLYTTQKLHQLGLFAPPFPPCTRSMEAQPLRREQSEPPNVPEEREVIHCRVKDATFFPDMPVHISQNLKIAFDVYSMPSHGSPTTILGFKVRDALLYAGVPDTLMAEDQGQVRFTLDNFLSLGRSAVMARFSGEQVASVRKVFQCFDADGSGELDREELDFVMRQLFFPRMSIAEIDGMARFWDNDASGSMDEEEFCKIASRLVRQRQLDWLFLSALKSLSGDVNLDITDGTRVLTAEAISENSCCELSKEQMEEMLWVADWRHRGQSAGSHLNIDYVLSAVMMRIHEPTGALPPANPTSSRPCIFRPSCLKLTAEQLNMEAHRMKQVSSNNSQDLIKPDDDIRATTSLRAALGYNIPSVNGSPHQTPPVAIIDRSSANSIVPNAAFAEVDCGLCTSPDIKCPSCGLCLTDPDSAHVDLVFDLRVSSVRERALLAAGDDLYASFEATESMRNRQSSPLSDATPDSSSSPLVTQPPAFQPEDRYTCIAKLYLLLYEPQSSVPARLLWMFMLLTVVMSLVPLALRPILERHVSDYFPVSFWECLEVYFTVLFSVEIALRYLVASRLRTDNVTTFCMKHVCDIVSLVPYYFELILNINEEALKLLRISRLVRFTSVLRVARIAWLQHKPLWAQIKHAAGAIGTVFVVIWGIYLKNKDD